MVSVMLLFLLFGILQVAVYLHVRNAVSAAAAEGARVAANEDRGLVDGIAVTQDLVANGLSQDVSDSLDCTHSGEDNVNGRPVVVVNCTASVPVVFGLMGSLPLVDVTGRAMDEG